MTAKGWERVSQHGAVFDPEPLMKLLTDEQRAKLIDNGRRQEPVRGTELELDLWPVVKFFTPDAGCTWLLTEIEPDTADDIAWGLCDLGLGIAECGTVSLAELAALHGRLGPSSATCIGKRAVRFPPTSTPPCSPVTSCSFRTTGPAECSV